MKAALVAMCAAILVVSAACAEEPPAGPAENRLPEIPQSSFDRGGTRDPFNPPNWRPPEEIEADNVGDGREEDVSPPVELRLTGIIRSRSGGDRLAILNGRILASGERATLRRGQRVLRVEVLDVGEQEVLVSADGEKVRLRLQRAKAGGS